MMSGWSGCSNHPGKVLCVCAHAPSTHTKFPFPANLPLIPLTSLTFNNLKGLTLTKNPFPLTEPGTRADMGLRAQVTALRCELLTRRPDDYAARRRFAEVEALIAQLDRSDGVRRNPCCAP